ncbi:MAG: efflux RND transporter periplasmic adaptor subunit, partial [Legionellaceae bacterium]|nr:efflux RND transporter periplasmic adaptor subunit [Legionellaceae bacterium]
LDLAEGNLIRSIAQVEYQKVQYERMKILVAKDDISRSHYDEVHARYKEAVGEVQVQKAQVEKAQINLGYCTMLAPFDAIIGKKYVDVGNLVGSGESTLLAQVVQMNPMYVIFNPSVADYEEMFSYIQNQPFSIQASLPMGNATFTGTLNLINNVVDQGTSTVMMRATVENPKLFLLPGVFVNVTMQLGQNPKTILVPTKAIMDLQGQSMVYVVDKNSVISSRIIQISGEYKTSTIIKSGLQVGDKVVISGLQKLRPGQKVVAVSA